MAKDGKRKTNDSFDDDEENTSNKRGGNKGSVDSESGILACELSHNRKVYVRRFKGQVYVDIREFYEGKSGPMPGKKGISLTLDQWKILCDHSNDVDEAIDDDPKND